MGLCKGGPYKLTLVHNHQHTLCLKKGTPTLSTVTLEKINGF